MSNSLNRARKQYTRWVASKEGQQVKAQIYRHQLGLCYHCKGLLQMSDFELDHLVSLDLGGKNTVDNLYASCKPCNRKKGAALLETKLNWWLKDREDYA